MASVINAFKESIDLAKKNYLKLLGLYLLILVIVAVLAGLIILFTVGAVLGVVPGISSPLVFIPLALIVVIAFILIFTVFYGMYFSLAIQGMKNKGKTDLGIAFRDSKKVYRKMLWTLIIQIVITVIILVIIVTPVFLLKQSANSGFNANSGSLQSQLASVGITLVLIAVTFILDALFFVAVPLAMLDGSSGIGAIRKSFTVARKYFWSIIGLLILSWITYIVVYAVTEILALGLSIVNSILGIIVSFVLIVLLGSFMIGVVSFLPVIFYKRFVKS